MTMSMVEEYTCVGEEYPHSPRLYTQAFRMLEYHITDEDIKSFFLHFHYLPETTTEEKAAQINEWTKKKDDNDVYYNTVAFF